ncbi:protocadherin Fat 3-like [Salvelinus fontinalis]|uniref:protocadherin Fat 3-like n=1 Tax=Salvelinus fontinalis TaxID=8038 RepID=UPI002486847F|nr:protocadherin Fat 3-like [Salvelinus fontinalis]
MSVSSRKGNGYGQSGNGYGQSGNGYGQSGNGYGQSGNGYGQSGNGYGQSGNGYGQSGNGYGQSGNGYGQSGNGYGQSGNVPSLHCVGLCLQVTVMDSPVMSRLSTVWVIVHIQDENDNIPSFTESVYRISLPERDRNKRGDPIYRVFASDLDLDTNGNITYSIVGGNDDEKFSIDPLTAMVSSHKMVTAGSYDIITIKALDGGNSLLWSTVKLHIEWVRKPVPSLLPLVFSQRYYNFSISEGTAVGQPVGLVSVRKTDTPLWFDIIGGRAAREVFYIPKYICGRNCSSEAGTV